jgi:D-tyrosyl-tRNA(Tyr) deacylase
MPEVISDSGMRLVIQRVSHAHITVGQSTVGSVGIAVCVFLGIKKGDEKANVERLTEKLMHLRMFKDEQGKMNRSVIDVRGEVLVISEFTLYGNCAKGHRPSFSDAAPTPDAERLYNYFVDRLRKAGLNVVTGVFGAKMNVSLTNDGPVTFIMDG